jgi:1-hydroxycarotenoid 3,4-desaturase
VAEITVSGGRATGVRLASGESIAADAVVSNADVSALATGLLGDGVRRAVKGYKPKQRSLSAVTWCLVAEARGFPLVRHTVFFSDDYPAEFDDIFKRDRLPGVPTVYLCAQDRDDRGTPQSGRERIFCLVNAPARGDRDPLTAKEVQACEEQAFSLLERCGLTLSDRSEAVVTSPNDFNQLFPATGGALYGPVTHGWRASFARPGARAKVGRLYLVGGSVHPGAGVPMAALSGKLAADCLIEDLGSTSR